MTEPTRHPLRIALWYPQGSGTHYGGPSSFSYRLYRVAPPGRYNLELVHGNPNHARYDLFEAQHYLAPIPTGPVSLWRYLRAADRWLADNARRFDIFHGLSGFHATVQPAFRAQQLGLPAVLFITNYGIELSDKGGWRGLLGLPRKRRQMVRHLSAVVAMSRAIYDELLQYGIPEANIARIPMGVDTDRFRPADAAERRELRQRLGWPDRPTLVFAGGLTPRKRPHLLAEAVGIAKRAGLDCQLVLAGPEHDAPYCHQIRSRVDDLGIADRVIWNGFTDDIAPVYRAGDVFGLPSECEGMPASLVEAMACGLPALATPISGSSDLVTDGVQGRMVEPTPESVGQALVDYLRDPSLAVAHGRAAREKVLQGYSAIAVLEAYDQLFRRVIAGKPAAG
jgi:glycosyltransferase involved in cell wall biosynthesis